MALAAPERLGLRTAQDGRPGLRALLKEVATTGGSARRLARLARDADAVHSNSLWSHLDCAVAGRMARRPVVLELHDLVRPGLGRSVLKVATRLAAATVAISAAVADTVGSSSGRVQVVPQGVDTERFHPGAADASWRDRLSGRPDEPIVGVVGRVDPEKGITDRGRGDGHVGRRGGRSRLAVVGAPALDDGSYDAAVRAEASALLGDRARFVGPVDDVPAVLRSLDVLVNASASEPFGLSVLEAQASGVPVIGTDAGGIPEFVTDGETGLLVAPGRPDELAAGLSRTPRRTRPAARARGSGACERRGPSHPGGPGGRLGRCLPLRGRRRSTEESDSVRTLMVTKFVPLPDNNGGHQRSLAIARRLAELGDVVLCAYDDGSADTDGLRDLGIDVRAVPWRLGPGQARPWCRHHA